MSTFLRLDFPLTVSQGFHGELQFPSHGPFPQLFAFFLGNLEESRTGGFGRSEQKLTWSLHWREQEAPGSHARACVLTHTHDSPSVIHSWKEHSPNYPKAPLGVLHPIRSNSWGGGGHRKKEKGNNKAVDFSHLTPPPSTFSTSLLPSFASPVNAIKRKSMSDPLGTWNAAYKLPAFLAITGPVWASIALTTRRELQKNTA